MVSLLVLAFAATIIMIFAEIDLARKRARNKKYFDELQASLRELQASAKSLLRKVTEFNDRRGL